MKDLLLVLENTADGAFVINDRQEIVFWNKAAEALLGYPADEVLGESCFVIVRGKADDDSPICQFQCAVASTVLSGKTVTNYSTCAYTKAGNPRWIDVSTMTLPGKGENNSAVIVHLFRDATKEKKNERFIRRVMNAADRLSVEEASPPKGAPRAESLLGTLTDREREVLSLLVNGLQTADIAQQLSISPATARNHIQNILHKLHVHSRLEAVAYASEHGIGRG